MVIMKLDFLMKSVELDVWWYKNKSFTCTSRFITISKTALYFIVE